MIKIMRMLFKQTPARYQVASVCVRKFVRVPVHTDDTRSPHMFHLPVVSLSPWHSAIPCRLLYIIHGVYMI